MTAITSRCKCFFWAAVLRHGGAGFYKLSLFRRGKGRFECRLKDQDASMADMEVHEHVIVPRAERQAEESLAASQRGIHLALHSEA